MSESLTESLPKQIERVTAKRDRWIKITQDHPEMASGMNIGIALMQHEIMNAVKASASGDVAAMIEAHEALAAYGDDD